LTAAELSQPEGHITPTRLQSYLYCGRQYYFQYIEGLTETPKLANTQGTIGHRLLEFDSDLWGLTPKNLPDGMPEMRILNHFDLIFYMGLQEARANGLDLTAEQELEMHTFLSETIYSFKQQEKIRRMEITQREVKLEYPFKGKIITGTIDALVRFPDTPEGYVEIVDYKFGRRGQVDTQLNRNIQQALYYLAARHNGFKVHRNWWVHMRHFQPYKKVYRGKAAGDLRGPGFIPIKICDADTQNIYDLAGPIVDAINARIFPANAYGDACKTCQFTEKCPRFAIGTNVQEEFIV
jgi:CRISPR/Cas system-associated exonuclease Cas4 (RecB family)